MSTIISNGTLSGGTLNVFSPLTYNVHLWFDANDLTTITKDGSNEVSQWNNKSVVANNARQGLGVNQATYQFNVITGLPEVKYNGTNNFMDLDSFTTPEGVFTLYIAMYVPTEITSASPVATILATQAPSHPRGLVQTGNITGTIPDETFTVTTISGGTTRRNYIKDNISAGNHIISFSNDAASNSVVEIDSVSKTIFKSSGGIEGGQNRFRVNRMGATRTPAGYMPYGIFEICLFLTDLSASEKQMMDNYLSNKWGI